MAIHQLWSDEYWLLLLQVYFKKPVGLKPTFARSMVELSLELHISPRVLSEKLKELIERGTPTLESLWKKYGDNPKKLKKEAKRIREMKGFGQAETFYEGVETNETFEKDFLPINDAKDLNNVILIMVLDLYFQLTPITMVEETPEVKELAHLVEITSKRVVEILEIFQFCDPHLNNSDLMISPILLPCQMIWDRYGTKDPNILSQLATELQEYFKRL